MKKHLRRKYNPLYSLNSISIKSARALHEACLSTCLNNKHLVVCLLILSLIFFARSCLISWLMIISYFGWICINEDGLTWRVTSLNFYSTKMWFYFSENYCFTPINNLLLNERQNLNLLCNRSALWILLVLLQYDILV